ncbi:hypothetical protein L6452_09283 [Arctium lappa]|uniref:Uncharacterized protein n=1 Tax=Arctium lappa TaxID=4217 RepID=A0ACB9DK60_ARCLA|nr:hypothetical protein L6452_09283 [Arctium lappa]
MFIIQQPENFSFHGTITYHVAVFNGFSGNSSLPLIIWCTTVGDAYGGDMGGRALQESDDYSWNVKVTFWKSISSDTAFSCTMKWDQKRKKFEAFRVHRDRSRCGVLRKCLWLVKEDGFYFSNDEHNWVKEFSWT